ncbi:ammonium transporter [Blastococcus sp. TML/M2B]|uniref:ammonium transporter n=1 Tax=unclassified Blastococcus TaxID=2619396 RepID=UPI00190BF4B8|nr:MULTISPECIES: ammonium transporter [unclassified Blastococcus]MBN1092315.1 ammonium transporter [Blastococcus sp. TML/M2B]MBN1097593.1 ammonium transporter [Blastococcus sp. TML/C7B]
MDPTTTGNTAWLLTAIIAVVLMLPGLVLFYGGMVSRRTTTNMMMMVFGAFALTAFTWVAVGYSAVFGDSLGGAGLLGNPLEFAGLGQLLSPDDADGLPPLGLAAIHLSFAGLTIGIIAGAAADRMKFGAWMVFAGLWVVLCYLPVAHWTFAFDAEDGSTTGGWLANVLGAVDYAGSTPIHVNSGIAALALAIVLGKRRTWPVQPKAHNLPFVVVGVGLLLTGWLGFDGSALGAADNDAAVAIFNTLAAACAGACAWLVVEKVRDGHATTLGACSGAIAALVAITPSCGTVSPVGAMAIGVAAGVVCYFAVLLKHRFGYDDALDVVALHLVGGIVGALAIGLIAHPDAPTGVAGLLYGGGAGLLGKQALALLATCAWTFTLTFLLAKVLDRTVGIRVTPEQERQGLDTALHAESAYENPSALAHQPRGHAEQEHHLHLGAELEPAQQP